MKNSIQVLLVMAAFLQLQAHLPQSWQEVDLQPLPEQLRKHKSPTNWTFAVFMAADNDLFPFALRDLQEMAKIGSNANVAIVVQVDGAGYQEKTKRLYIQNGNLYEVQVFDAKQDSGSDKTVIEFFDWVLEHYPAQHYALDFWNHGAGVLDPSRHRGVCFSDTFGTYLTNQKLENALKVITTKLGKKLDVVAFDACLMAMLEIADIVRFYANYMVASQETEPGDGWNYSEVLAPLAQEDMSPYTFAKHAVESYRVDYLSKTKEFTQSAFDLQKSHLLIDNLNRVSQLLVQAFEYQVNDSLLHAIEVAKDPKYCTHFAEPSYIDMYQFYNNLRIIIPFLQVQEGHSALFDQLVRTLDLGVQYLEDTIIGNVRGDGYSHVGGVSLYFPEHAIDSSYKKTYFARDNAWIQVLQYCVA